MRKHLPALGALLLILFILFAWAPRSAPAQATIVVSHLGQPTFPLDGPWQFHAGDDPAWSSPSLDDSKWEAIAIDRPWGSQTHFGYTGFAWYRRHVQFDPATPPPAGLSLLLPPIYNVYQVYWQGKLIVQHGTMPPHPSWTADLKTIVPLPPQGSVLAIRVWVPPHLSGDSGTAGGSTGIPLLGTRQALEDRKAVAEYSRLESLMGVVVSIVILALVGLAGFVGWLQDRQRRILFWMGAWSFSGIGLVWVGLTRMQIPQTWIIAASQLIFACTDISVWYLTLHLLELNHIARITRRLAIASWISLALMALDSLLVLTVWTGPHPLFGQIGDFAVTIPNCLLEITPLILIGYAIGRQRLNHARWLVAGLGAASQFIFGLRNALIQGQRFTHWTFADKLIPLQNVIGLLLPFAIVYAVWRFSSDQRARQAAIQQEYLSAQELQRVLIPETLPPLPGFAITTAYRPAQQVGGDFFQVVSHADGSSLIVLGDVSGKGLKAAMTVSLIVGAARTLVEASSDPATILAGLNRRLHGRLQEGFATCLVLRLDTSENCVFANAGHLPPFLNGEEFDLPPALPLGLDPGATYETTIIPLEIGSTLTLYTDGLLEARNPSTGELFGFDRLQQLLATNPDATHAADGAVAFGQDDDITVLTLTRLAAGIQSTTQLSAPKLAQPTLLADVYS